MPKKHVNIPIFIPHLGCPNACVFCDQRSISGRLSFDRFEVGDIIDRALSTVDPDTTEAEIAFFGGSFTGIDRELMIYLLDCAQKRIDEGYASAIRCSTRPDYIDNEVLDVLSKYSMKTIELGIQSLSDRVLSACRRGHTAEQSVCAMKLIKDRGLSVVGQMMIGLPESDSASEVMTAEVICECGADAARIYPTVVLNDTELCDMACRGSYMPMSLEEAVERTASAFEVMVKNHVNVIRIGLQSGERLESEGEVRGGGYTPALGELVKNRYYLRLIERTLDKLPPQDFSGRVMTVYIPSGSYSKVMGHRRCNRDILIGKYRFAEIKAVESEDVEEYTVKIEIDKEKD